MGKRSAIVGDVEYFRERVNPLDARLPSRIGACLLLSADTQKTADQTQKQLMACGHRASFRVCYPGVALNARRHATVRYHLLQLTMVRVAAMARKERDNYAMKIASLVAHWSASTFSLNQTVVQVAAAAH
jgi:hypothetical protein